MSHAGKGGGTAAMPPSKARMTSAAGYHHQSSPLRRQTEAALKLSKPMKTGTSKRSPKEHTSDGPPWCFHFWAEGRL